MSGGVIEEVYNRSLGAEDGFKNKKVLFIPSESYCGATITIIEGLHNLGFEIVVPFKSNINSWFCETVVDPYDWLHNGNRPDFVVSNLHWGTRWDYYDQFGLGEFFKVLLDGDDSRHGLDWKQRYWGWMKVYGSLGGSPPPLPSQSPRRVMFPLRGYEPDLAFSSQKAPTDFDSVYLPYGIQDVYVEHSRSAGPVSHRPLDVLNIGPSASALLDSSSTMPTESRVASTMRR
jgi:hypothetical protein